MQQTGWIYKGDHWSRTVLMHYLAYVVFVEVYKCLARSFLIIFIPQTLELVSEKDYSNYPVQYIQ
jgi:hypothetical protein